MMNEHDAVEIRKTLADLERKAQLAREFVASEYGKYLVKSLDDLIASYTEQGESLAEAAPLRCYDAAKGARAAKELIDFPIKAMQEGGIADTLREQLRRATGSQVD